jgi:hypothetical protein
VSIELFQVADSEMTKIDPRLGAEADNELESLTNATVVAPKSLDNRLVVQISCIVRAVNE